MAIIAWKSMDSGEPIYYKTREIRQKHVFLHPRFWIGILNYYVLRHFSSFKKYRAFLPESIFGHFLRAANMQRGKMSIIFFFVLVCLDLVRVAGGG